MRHNRTLKLLRGGEPALGAWLQLGSVPAARLLAAQGLVDWLLVDFEHAPVGPETAAAIFGAVADVSGGRVTPLARVAAGTMTCVKHALDAGAQGIIVPMVHGPDEVREAARWARFPPAGERGAGALLAHLGLGIGRPEYLAHANAEVLLGVQIETREAVERVDEILDVPGVGLCFIGPNDLHMALGYAPRFWSDEPAFTAAVARVRAAASARGIPLGTLCRDAGAARARLDDGFTFVGVGSDAHYLLTFCGRELGELRGQVEPAAWCDLVRFDAEGSAGAQGLGPPAAPSRKG